MPESAGSKAGSGGVSLPASTAHPDRYRGMGLADLAREMHETMRAADAMRRLHDAFSALPEQALLPAEAYEHVVLGTVERVRLAELAERTTAVGIVPYPPGIPLLMPGERTGPAGSPWLSYLAALESFDRRFPGFEHETHGVRTVGGDYTVLCVVSP